MTDKCDFSDLTPPHNQVLQWIETAPSGIYLIQHIADQSSLWGAEQAAEHLKRRWPTPITDRAPTKADADETGLVAFLYEEGWGWVLFDWVKEGEPWRHTPRWQPPAPPTLKQQALQLLPEIEGEEVLHLCPLEVAKIRRAIEQLSDD